MAHWAEIDENGIVLQVTVGDNNDPNGDEGYQWLIDNLGGTWIKASYNTRNGVHYGPDGKPDGGLAFRKNYPGVGYTYDKTRDAFIPILPHETWVLDEETCNWVPPIPYPTDGKPYKWSDTLKTWEPGPTDITAPTE
jgi:hypothetical protein